MTTSPQLVQGMGIKMDFKEYDMGHSSCPGEMADVKLFIQKCIPDAPPAPIPSDLESLSPKELKEILKARSIDTSDCFEKGDLVAKVRSLL